LIFRALSDYQLYSLYDQLQTYHSARQTRYVLYIRENIQEHWISQIFYSSYCWCR
jgi:hypothetical protein